MGLWSLGEETMLTISNGLDASDWTNFTTSLEADTSPRRSARREDSSWRRSHVWTGQYITRVSGILQQPQRHQSGILIGVNGRARKGGNLFLKNFPTFAVIIHGLASTQPFQADLYPHGCISCSHLLQMKGRAKSGGNSSRSTSLTSVFWHVAKKRKSTRRYSEISGINCQKFKPWRSPGEH